MDAGQENYNEKIAYREYMDTSIRVCELLHEMRVHANYLMGIGGNTVDKDLDAILGKLEKCSEAISSQYLHSYASSHNKKISDILKEL